MLTASSNAVVPSERFALRTASVNDGYAIMARMPTIATTIISSISVNPLPFEFFIDLQPLLNINLQLICVFDNRDNLPAAPS